MRNDAFAQLGDTTMDDVQIQGDSPTFTVTGREPTPGRGRGARADRRGDVRGAVLPPAELRAARPLRARPRRPAEPERHLHGGFRCGIPRAAARRAPGRPQVYGHGLLGTGSQATSGDQQILGQTHNFVFCAVDTIGFSNGDVGNIAATSCLTSNFPELTDRVQQGLLNTLYLGRLMWHPDGLSERPGVPRGRRRRAPPSSTPPASTTTATARAGSWAGATAVAPDWTRASLGVPAMNYSVLLNRSVDFDLYKRSWIRRTRAR